MPTYKELLRHPNWQKKRLLILNRDNWTCQACQDTQSNLQVHHKYYNGHLLPWEYPDDVLITYCDLCHLKAEFYKWVKNTGVRSLVFLGFIRSDIDAVVDMVFRKVESNHHRESVTKYMDDIKKLMTNG